MSTHPTLYIYAGEAERLGRWVQEFRTLETGGELFGQYLPSGAFVVQLVTGPGPKARRTATSFYQDGDYLRAIGEAAFEHHALQHGGTWHSHHALELAEPSEGDSNTMVRALESSGAAGMILVIANLVNRRGQRSRRGSPQVGAFLYRPAFGGEYDVATWTLLPGESPVRTGASTGPLTRLLPEPLIPSSRVELVSNPPSPPAPPSSPWATTRAAAAVALSATARFDELGDVSMFLSPAGQLELHLDVCGVAWVATFDEAASGSGIGAWLSRSDASDDEPFFADGELGSVLDQLCAVIAATHAAPEPRAVALSFAPRRGRPRRVLRATLRSRWSRKFARTPVRQRRPLRRDYTR